MHLFVVVLYLSVCLVPLCGHFTSTCVCLASLCVHLVSLCGAFASLCVLSVVIEHLFVIRGPGVP